MRLSRAEIAELIPHAGAMCLLDGVLDWDASRIRCVSRGHRDAGNPLRVDGHLPALCGIEYAAHRKDRQLHSNLIAAQARGESELSRADTVGQRLWFDDDGRKALHIFAIQCAVIVHVSAHWITTRIGRLIRRGIDYSQDERRDVGHIDLQVSMVDPQAYFKPITFSMPIKLKADTEMLEFVCDNNRSRERIARGTAAQVVDVPVATLSRYVGVYDLVDENDANNKTVAAITLAGGALFLDYRGKGREELISLEATRFSWSGTVLEFSTAAGGAVTLTIHYAETSEGGPRRR